MVLTINRLRQICPAGHYHQNIRLKITMSESMNVVIWFKQYFIDQF